MFRFKQFTIEDANSAHKIGTDGTLLGAWVNITGKKHILDVGTGSGLIALMAAQRSSHDVVIEAVELSQTAFEQAKENVQQSPWFDKIQIHLLSIQQFKSNKKFDCIISNPPYFNNSFKPPDKDRITPRHTDTLSFEDLLIHSKRLLTSKGKLNVILPYTEGLKFINLAKELSLYLTRQWSFRTRAEKPVERWLLEFCAVSNSVEKGEILLYSKNEEWSEEYKNLTKDFYLKL